MSATRTRRSDVSDEAPPSPPQITPPYGAGMSNHGHDFTLQAVMEMQKSIGEMNSTLAATKSSVDGLKSKVEDLIGWKNKILGGALVAGALLSCAVWVLVKASDYISIKAPASATSAIPAPTQAKPPASRP